MLPSFFSRGKPSSHSGIYEVVLVRLGERDVLEKGTTRRKILLREWATWRNWGTTSTKRRKFNNFENGGLEGGNSVND